MAGNITFTMIKPKAVADGNMGHIISEIIDGGFTIIAMKFVRLTKKQAQKFYEIHKDRPFYDDLVEFMISGPIIAAILEKENAVEEYRNLIGATNPENANKGTIRAKFGTDMRSNAVHGSDSDENAEKESTFFFSYFERYHCL